MFSISPTINVIISIITGNVEKHYICIKEKANNIFIVIKLTLGGIVPSMRWFSVYQLCRKEELKSSCDGLDAGTV